MAVGEAVGVPVPEAARESLVAVAGMVMAEVMVAAVAPRVVAVDLRAVCQLAQAAEQRSPHPAAGIALALQPNASLARCLEGPFREVG